MGLPAGEINDFFRDKQGSMERVNPSEKMRLAVPAAPGIAELRQRVTIPPFPLFKCRHEYYDCLAHSRHCRLARANRPRLLANQPF